jgi:hypothetical protein
MTVSDYSHPEHQPIVPPWAGVPWCTCGWKGRPYDGPILADHLAEVGSVPLSHSSLLDGVHTPE